MLSLVMAHLSRPVLLIFFVLYSFGRVPWFYHATAVRCLLSHLVFPGFQGRPTPAVAPARVIFAPPHMSQQQQQQQATQVKVDTSFNIDYFSEIS